MSRINYISKKATILNIKDNDVLILIDGVKQPKWITKDEVKIYNKGINL